jgi:uncharacterized protein (TIGR03435 family)
MHDHLETTKITMSEFAQILSRNLKLPVVDRTDLAGAFNFTLRWNPDNADVSGGELTNAAKRTSFRWRIACVRFKSPFLATDYRVLL